MKTYSRLMGALAATVKNTWLRRDAPAPCWSQGSVSWAVGRALPRGRHLQVLLDSGTRPPRQVYSLYAGKSLQEHPRDCAEVPPKPNQSSILIKYGSISRSRINTKAPNNLNGYNLCNELFFRR